MDEQNERPVSLTDSPSLRKSRWPLTLFLIGLAMWILAFACFGPAFKELRFLALWIPGGMIGITGISMWVIGDETSDEPQEAESDTDASGDGK